MSSNPSLWEAAAAEMEEYAFTADATLQPVWGVPETVAINVAVASRSSFGTESEKPVDIEDYINEASSVIEAGACGVHIDFTWVTDSKGRRLDKDLPPTEAYGLVLEPLRERFGNSFVPNLNVLNGKTFEECLSPVTSHLAEVAPCAAGHPESFVLPAIETIIQNGVSPEIVVHSSGEIEFAKRRLYDTGLIKPGSQTNWLILFALPVDVGRTLISGAYVTDTKSLATHLILMVDQIRQIDPKASISVCNAGRAGLYITALALMMGLNIRVGLEDSIWRYPNSNQMLKSNLELFESARSLAAQFGRTPASADSYREQIGLPKRGK